MDSRGQSGNVLFLILIAVALFAALSYAVTSSSRVGGGNGSKETATSAASQILQHGSALRVAIQRMMLIKGCTIEQISFYTDKTVFTGSWRNLYLNPNSPPDFSCHVYYPEGGGMPYIPTTAAYPKYFTYTGVNPPPSFVMSYVPLGRGQIHGVGLDYGTDLILAVYNVNESLCTAFNELVDNPTTIYNARVIGFPDAYKGSFVGSGANDSYAAIGNSDSPALYGRAAGCVRNPDDNFLNIYLSLVDR